MVLLQVENVTKSFGDLVLFENISFSIHKNDKIGLIARNGTGKTTLLNIITKKDSPDSGTIIYRNNITISYLQQQPILNNNDTVYDILYKANENLFNALENYKFAVKQTDENILSDALSEMDRYNAWNLDTQIQEFIFRFKLPTANTKVAILSGGQKRRLALARLLIQKPDILILDEPTNHLDVEMIEWLEDYLNQEINTLLLVTHDRYFLENVCNRIIELDNKQLFEYEGNFSYFLEKRSERIQQHKAEIEKARNLYRKELDWIRRMPKARTHKAKYRIEAFKKIEEKATQQISENQIEIKTAQRRLGKKVIDIYNLEKSYGNNILIKSFNYKIAPGDRIGIVGPNGCGKTTFLELILNKIKPDAGRIEYGDTVVMGYFSQENVSYPAGKRVIDVVKDIAEYTTTSDGQYLSASQLLSYFLFPPSIQFIPVEKLSGGEKRRLQLVTVLMKKPNVLLLDEPTNDLDVLTLNVLEEYLLNFNGCVLAVSHDRYFLDKIAKHIFAFESNGVIKDFPGNYTQYQDQKKKIEVKSQQVLQPQKQEKIFEVKNQKKKLSYKEQKELEQLEIEIKQLYSEKESIEAILMNPQVTGEEISKLAIQHNELKMLIENKENRWIELMEKIE